MAKLLPSVVFIITSVLICSIEVAHCDDYDFTYKYESTGPNVVAIVAPIVSLVIVILIIVLICRLCCGCCTSTTTVRGAVIAIPQSQQQQQQQVSQIIISPGAHYPHQGMQPPQQPMQPQPQYPPPPPQYSQQPPVYQNPNFDTHKDGFVNPTYQPDRAQNEAPSYY